MENLETHESVFLIKVNYLGYLTFVANNQLFIIPITFFIMMAEMKLKPILVLSIR
jgi:hypothetical protein